MVRSSINFFRKHLIVLPNVHQSRSFERSQLALGMCLGNTRSPIITLYHLGYGTWVNLYTIAIKLAIYNLDSTNRLHWFFSSLNLQSFCLCHSHTWGKLCIFWGQWHKEKKGIKIFSAAECLFQLRSHKTWHLLFFWNDKLVRCIFSAKCKVSLESV